MFEKTTDSHGLCKRPLQDPLELLINDILAESNDTGKRLDGHTSIRHSCLKIWIQWVHSYAPFIPMGIFAISIIHNFYFFNIILFMSNNLDIHTMPITCYRFMGDY